MGSREMEWENVTGYPSISIYWHCMKWQIAHLRVWNKDFQRVNCVFHCMCVEIFNVPWGLANRNIPQHLFHLCYLYYSVDPTPTSPANMSGGGGGGGGKKLIFPPQGALASKKTGNLYWSSKLWLPTDRFCIVPEIPNVLSLIYCI